MAVQARAGDREAMGCGSPSLAQFTGWAEVPGQEVRSWRAFVEQMEALRNDPDIATGCIGRAEGRSLLPCSLWWVTSGDWRYSGASAPLIVCGCSYCVLLPTVFHPRNVGWVQCLQEHGREKQLIEMLWAWKQLPVLLVQGWVRRTWDRMTYSKILSLFLSLLTCRRPPPSLSI